MTSVDGGVNGDDDNRDEKGFRGAGDGGDALLLSFTLGFRFFRHFDASFLLFS